MFQNKLQKQTVFDYYNQIITICANIKSSHVYMTYSPLTPNNLVEYMSHCSDILDKLGDINCELIKKENDDNTLPKVKAIITKMRMTHIDLEKCIIEFTKISQNTLDEYKDITSKNYNQDIINITFFNLISKSKITLCEIQNKTKELISYYDMIKLSIQ